MVDEHQVVNVAAVEANPEIMFDEMIKTVQVKVGEDLAGQVPDRQTTVRRCTEQGLASGQADPIAAVTFHHTVFARSVEHDCAAHLNKQRPITADVTAVDEACEPVEQDLSIDVHEETRNVQREHIGVTGVVCRTRPDEPLQAVHREQGSLTGTRGVGVVAELGLEQRVQLVDDQMVHHPVTEGCGEDFPLHRLVHDERDAGPRPIASPGTAER